MYIRFRVWRLASFRAYQVSHLESIIRIASLLSKTLSSMTVNCLEVSCNSGKSRVTKMKASYPCKFLTTNAAAGISANVFILGFGGGVVSGDCQEMQVKILERAVLFLRTQGSTKIFKSVDGKFSSQHSVFSLLDDSLLAFLPDPTSCFKGSRYYQHQVFDMSSSARSSSGDCWNILNFIQQQKCLLICCYISDANLPINRPIVSC